jgi:hypothetical protein
MEIFYIQVSNFRALPMEQWPTFLSFGVQPWNLDHLHSLRCKIDFFYLDFDMWPTVLSCDV